MRQHVTALIIAVVVIGGIAMGSYRMGRSSRGDIVEAFRSQTTELQQLRDAAQVYQMSVENFTKLNDIYRQRADSAEKRAEEAEARAQIEAKRAEQAIAGLRQVRDMLKQPVR